MPVYRADEKLVSALNKYGYYGIDAPGIAKPSSAIEIPVLAEMLALFYPSTSMLKRETGVVVMEMCVSADGHPHDIALLRSSGHERLDEATRTLMRGLPFNPARLADKPVPFCGYLFAISWTLPPEAPDFGALSPSPANP